MSSRRFCWLSAVISTLTICALARAQETPATDAGPPPGVEKFYWDLSQSKDPKDREIKSMAERYLNLVKVQEWSDLSGNFRRVARYVKHDPNLTTVTIEIVKGRGAERTTEQKTVPVDKLSKSCQSRVKQIDTMQKKIKEMAKANPGENGAVLGPGASPEAPGGPLPDERGPGAAPAPSPQPTVAAPDPSASEPDPLGFAEIVLTPVIPPGGTPPASDPPPDERR